MLLPANIAAKRLVFNALSVLHADYLCQAVVRGYQRKRVLKLDKVRLHISGKCNYSCRYCYVDRQEPALGSSDWLRIIRESKGAGARKIAILGGEPLLMDELPQLLEEISRLRMQAQVYTNGSLLDAKMICWLKKYSPVLVVKYDANELLYRLHTCQDNYPLAQVEENIRRSRQAGIRVLTFTVLCKENVGQCGQTAIRSLSLGAFPVFERYAPVHNAQTNNVLEISNAQYDLASEEIREALSGFLKSRHLPFLIGAKRCDCYNSSLSVTASGEVLPCPYLPESVSLGNVMASGISSIYRIMLQKQSQEYRPAKNCLSCRSFSECAGGCRTYAYLKHGKFSGSCHKESAMLHCGATLSILYGDLI